MSKPVFNDPFTLSMTRRDRWSYAKAFVLQVGIAAALLGSYREAAFFDPLLANAVWVPCFGILTAWYLAITSQRFRDMNRSGAWALASLVPLVGWLLLGPLLLKRGSAGRNRFGRNPARGRSQSSRRSAIVNATLAIHESGRPPTDWEDQQDAGAARTAPASVRKEAVML